MNPNKLLTFLKELQTSTQQSKQISPQNPTYTTKDIKEQQLTPPQGSQEEKLSQNKKQFCCMETTPTHKDKTQHKQSSPKSKCQDKPRQQSQSRYKQDSKTLNETPELSNKYSTLEKMELEENPQTTTNKSHKTENTQKHET